MSWDIPISATDADPAAFAAAAAAAYDLLEAQLADADDTTRTAVVNSVAAATAAASLIVASGALGAGLVSGRLTGQVATDASPYMTVAVQLSCAPTNPT